MLLIMALSPLYVRRLARRLTHPLTELTQGVQTAKNRGDDDRWQLSVPKQPAEIVSLTQNFNQLLKKLYNHQAEQQLLERHGQEQPRDHPQVDSLY